MKARDLAAIVERVRRPSGPIAVIAEARDGWEWAIRDGRTSAVLASGSADKRAIADMMLAASAIALRRRRGE